MTDKSYEELKLIKQFMGMQVQITKEMLLEIKGLRRIIGDIK